MDVLRTPDERFTNLPGYSFAPHYTEVSYQFSHHVVIDNRAAKSGQVLLWRPDQFRVLQGISDSVICFHHRLQFNLLDRRWPLLISQTDRQDSHTMSFLAKCSDLQLATGH